MPDTIYTKNWSKITLTCLGRPLCPRIVVDFMWLASLLELSVTSEPDHMSCKKKSLHMTKQSAELIPEFLQILRNRESLSDNILKQQHITCISRFEITLPIYSTGEPNFLQAPVCNATLKNHA